MRAVGAHLPREGQRPGRHRVVNISADLPFAHKRFCAAEDIENATAGSTFRSDFASDYGVKMTDGPMA